MTRARTDRTRSQGALDVGVVLRPRTLDQTFDLALFYTRRHARAFLKLLVVVWALAILAVWGYRWITQSTWLATWPAVFLVAAGAEKVVTMFTAEHLFQRRATPGRALLAVIKKLFVVLLAMSIVSLPWYFVFSDEASESPTVPLGIWLGLAWWPILASRLYFSIVYLLEDLPFREVHARTRIVMHERFARALGFVFVGTLTRALGVLAFEVITRFFLGLVFQLGDPIDSLMEDGGSWPAVTGYIVASAFVATARFFDYVDARTRMEGWDIQARFFLIAQNEEQREGRARGVT